MRSFAPNSPCKMATVAVNRDIKVSLPSLATLPQQSSYRRGTVRRDCQES